MISQRTFFPLLDHENSQVSQNTICAMASHNRRRSSIDSASVQTILTSGESGKPLASPNPHVGSSPNRTHFAMSPPPRPPPKHSRALSYTPRRPNRLSLSFPIAASTNILDSARPTPTSSNSSSFPPTPAEVSIPSPNDPNGFLVSLASQERKVLELKEELQKAEKELETLKTKWATHERTRKRAEIRHVEQLRPLQAAANDGGRSSEEADGATRHSIEQDRRKAFLSTVSKEPRRKVITGGHHRTLSLLSPDRSHYARPFPAVEDADSTNNLLPRSTTMPDTSQGITKINTNRTRHSYQGGVTHGAKQIAEDVKAGLWTFLEDLRQATVGEEATATPVRQSIDTLQSGRKTSKGSLPRGQSSRGTSPRTWDTLTGLGLSNSTGPLCPEPSSVPVAKQEVADTVAVIPSMDDLDWSNWDSPPPKSPRWSGSTSELSNPQTPSHGNSEDRSIRIIDQPTDEGTPSKMRDELQWPALDKLTPGNLKRTVSTIMKEWEKSLTPPLEESEDASAIPPTAEKSIPTPDGDGYVQTHKGSNLEVVTDSAW